MKVFDFDNTLYRGESSLDFSLFMIRANKRILHFNFKDNKVLRFRELYGDRKIDAFYTDSYNDKAMMDISEKVYLIKNGKGKRIK